jgi:hypothetical protein
MPVCVFCRLFLLEEKLFSQKEIRALYPHVTIGNLALPSQVSMALVNIIFRASAM